MRLEENLRLGLAICVLLFVGCKPAPPNSPSGSAGSQSSGGGTTKTSPECPCVEYPFPAECDVKCGMAEFIVKGVDAKNKTVEVFTPGQPSQSRTLSLESLQAHQVQDIEPGSHIQVLFKKPEKEQSTIKPVRVMKLPQP